MSRATVAALSLVLAAGSPACALADADQSAPTGCLTYEMATEAATRALESEPDGRLMLFTGPDAEALLKAINDQPPQTEFRADHILVVQHATKDIVQIGLIVDGCFQGPVRHERGRLGKTESGRRGAVQLLGTVGKQLRRRRAATAASRRSGPRRPSPRKQGSSREAREDGESGARRQDLYSSCYSGCSRSRSRGSHPYIKLGPCWRVGLPTGSRRVDSFVDRRRLSCAARPPFSSAFFREGGREYGTGCGSGPTMTP